MKQKQNRAKIFKKNLPLLLMIAPAIIYLIIFDFLPMFGTIIAFKDFKYPRGIFGSEWVGLDNFKAFFATNDFVQVVGNTIAYSIASLVIGLIGALLIAILLYEITSKRLVKLYQTVLNLPRQISVIVLTYIVFAFLSSEYGLVNNLIEKLGGKGIDWYANTGFWPIFIIFLGLWQGAAQQSLLIYATLLGIDPSLYEAADIDGASRWIKFTRITLPSLAPVMATLLILGLSGVLNSGMGYFYFVPKDSSALRPVINVLDTHIYRLLVGGNVSVGAAIGMFKSLVGTLMLVTTNFIIKKIDPDKAMF